MSDLNELSEGDVKSIGEVMAALGRIAQAERVSSEPYKNMFKASEHGIRGSIENARCEVQKVLLNLHQVFMDLGMDESRSGELRDALSLLPFAYRHVRDNISEHEGMCCEADKTREVFNLYFQGFLVKNDAPAPAR